uniref:Protein kinase domain-containing protein n=1 Tax=Macrostomum lignano TaxID=282301 RepID=A0A1I8HH20_9PLAT
MGNQVGSVSSAEVNNKYNQCLQDLTEYELQTKLKETAFFKVVRSRHSEGDVVLKVYIPPNSSVPIKEYLDRIDAQKRVFPNPTNANVLPYQRCHYSERYACLVRQFVKYSLYDRMDTRPFLLDVEKRWIAFQLLCAIATLNKVSLCHGDIKSENVLLTSWGWVLLTDFAPFKPVFLPDDNPADYSFYFDISGRRTCYIAPERFYHANRSSAYGKAAAASASGVASTAAVEPDADFGLSQKQQNVKRGQLEHSMDVFSAGCVLLELFSEDSNSQPFDLSQLLAFKKDQYTPAKLILRLADENIRSHIAKFLILDSDKKSERNVGLVIILNLLTSSVRHVRFAQSKLDGLKCLEKLACHLPDHIVLDRILPYILDMMTDSSSRVRSGAILSLANTVGRIDTVGYKYVNLFADYIFPTVEHLSRDVSVQVRSSLAEILGRLADTAKKFLDSVREQSMAAWLPPMEGQNATTTALSQQEAQHLRAINFEAELQSLRRTVSASDHVMSHAITFLNEGPDLRWSFYEQLYCMVAFIGDHGAEMLVPLLEQGLADPDPAVLVAALICLRSLVADRSSDVGRRFGAPLCAKSLPLLSHPDVFVRHAASGLLCATAGRLGPAEFHCRLVAPDSPNSPRVSDHLPAAAKRLAGSQRHLANEVLVLSALGPPVPPAAWRCLATTPRHLVERLFVALEERRHVRLRCQTAGAGNIQDSAGGSGDESGAAADGPQQPCYARLEEDAAALLAKLGHLGLEESMEDRLLALRDLALKQTTASSAAALSTPSVSSAAVDYIGVERLKLSDLATVTEQQSVLPRHLSLSATGVTVSASNVIAASVLAGQPAASSLASMSAAAPAASLGATAASDFASGSSVAVAGSSPSAGGGAPAGSVSIATTAASGVVLPPASGRCATCRTDLDNLLARRRAEYGLLNSIASSVSYSNSSAGGSLASAAFPGCDTWTPKGVLVNHISEHRGRINSLSVSADHRAFATASDDATAGPDYSVVACTEAGAYQLCASTGQLRWRWSAARPTRYDAEQLGAITCLSPVPDSANCFLVATARGALLTWDVRTQDFVARYDVDPS